MPDPTLYLDLAFIAAVTILMALPGPNVALIVANSLAHGSKYGLVTVAGNQQRHGCSARSDRCGRGGFAFFDRGLV
jgi:hypothetical protein